MKFSRNEQSAGRLPTAGPSDTSRRRERARVQLAGLPPDTRRGAVLSEGSSALYCGVSRSTWRRLAKAGELPPAIRITPSRRGWRLSDLDGWLEARRQDAG